MGFMEKLFGPKSNATPVYVDDANYREEVLNHGGPILLDIWGPSCAPCQRLAPVMQSLARAYVGRVVGYHPKGYFDDMIDTEFGDEPETEAEAPEEQSMIPDADAEGLSKKALKKREKKARRKERTAS